jgi:hypothetical protein
LAGAFADRVYQKTGTLPSADQIKQFVAQNLNNSFAQKFILGMAPDQVNAIADQYLQGNPDALSTPGTKSAEEQRLSGLADQVNKLYDTGRQNLVSGYDQTVYNPGKTQLANDLAGQGMLTNPNSRLSFDNLESNRGRDLASGLNTLEGQRAQGNIDISKNIEDLLQQDKNRSQQAYQFNQGFNANRDDTAFNQGLQNKQLGIASQIGRLQANNNKKDWTDYLNTGINAIGTGAKIASMF